LAPGGDHHALLGIDKLPHGVDDVLERAPSAGAMRLRSGGRAATFAVGPDRDCLRGPWIDVKGVGTHTDADISSPHVTGLLCLADALRELGMQRLLQRVLDSECGDSHLAGDHSATARPSTVALYGIIDTGLTYAGINPATGWRNERCVLLLRQRQSRVVAEYECMSFSGNLPAGKRATTPGEPAAIFRRALLRHGLSCETFPSAIVADALVEGSAVANGEAVESCDHGTMLDRLVASTTVASRGNVQCDAAARFFMDTSDYYAHDAIAIGEGVRSLPAFWRMSSSALVDALCLGPRGELNVAAASRIAARALPLPAASSPSATAAPPIDEWARARRRHLAASKPAIREGVAVWETGSASMTPAQAKPKYCMCWAMELDDSPFATWCADTALAYVKHVALTGSSGAKELLGNTILHVIDANLPP
jgi:hypothetical protein